MKFKKTKKCVICNHEFETRYDRFKTCSTPCARMLHDRLVKKRNAWVRKIKMQKKLNIV